MLGSRLRGRGTAADHSGGEDGEQGLEWAPDAEVRILRVPPFALGIARKAVEEFVLDNYGPGANGTYAGEAEGARQNGANGAPANGATGGLLANGENGAHAVRALPMVTNERLDEAIRKLLPTHMQLIMGIGTAEELALAEVFGDAAVDGGEAFHKLSPAAAGSPAGASGVLFLPWVFGSGSPALDRRHRGAFLGLSLGTTSADMARAMLEGISMQMRWLADEVEQAIGHDLGAIRFVGGGAQSDVWTSIMADVVGRPMSFKASR